MWHRLHHAFHTGLDYLREYSAILLLAIGIVVSYAFISVEFWSIVGPILGITAGALIAVLWMIVRRVRSTKSFNPSSTTSIPSQMPIILMSLYVVTLLVGTRFYLHQRPTWLYVLFGLYASLIAYQIAQGGTHRQIVPQISVLAFFTYWSSQLLFPAGMYNPDTQFRYIPNIHTIYSTGRIPASETIYAGHYAFATEFSMLTGLTPQIGYYFLSTLLLILTIPIIAILDRVFPAITSKMALYAALIFSISSWMLRRGMHPNKLNFFYLLILLAGIAAIQLYRSEMVSRQRTRSWMALGFVTMPALIFGHQFSAGAAMIFLATIAVFPVISRFALYNYLSISPKAALPFVLVYVLSILGNPIHQGPLLTRLTNILTSIFQSGGSSSGGAGRYSEIALNILIASTAAQTLLFSLSILGAVWLFRQEKWEYDFVIFWLGGLSIFMIMSLLQNSADTQPQRFYAYLILFGFNICVGALLAVIDQRAVFRRRQTFLNAGRIAVVLLIGVLAVTSLASPIADEVTSPVADDLPHNSKFETEQRTEGEKWSEQYLIDPAKIDPKRSTVPIERTGANTGRADVSSYNSGTAIVYSSLAQRTGVVVSGGLSLGRRDFVFVESPRQSTDSRIYSNGGTSVFVFLGEI